MFVLVRPSPLPAHHISSLISPHISSHFHSPSHRTSPHSPQPLLLQLDFNYFSIFPICIQQFIHSFVPITLLVFKPKQSFEKDKVDLLSKKKLHLGSFDHGCAEDVAR